MVFLFVTVVAGQAGISRLPCYVFCTYLYLDNQLSCVINEADILQ